MKTLTLIIGLLLSLNANCQLLRDFGIRQSDEPYLIVTPSLAHNLSEVSLSSEAGLSIGIESITNKSTISVGYTYRRYYIKSINPNFHSAEINTSVYPFESFNLGVRVLSNLRKGEFYDEQLTIGNNILNKCGKVIGKEEDSRNLSNRSKMFGSIGLIYKVDANFRVETIVMLNDYNPIAWSDFKDSPYNNVLKIGLSYTIPVFQL